jgi:GT2 family glycosyltransferase
MDKKVSVVIPTLNRTHLLKRCVDALLAQTLDPVSYEIIIVDDASRKETEKLVENYSRREHAPCMRYIQTGKRRGPAAARNLGWQTAEAPVIAFTDDDCIPEPDWLTKGTAAFTEDVEGVSGRIFVPVGLKPTDYERNTSFLEFSKFATANCFYLKKTLAETGGFDERFTVAWREDADLYFSLLKLNKRLIVAPEAIVVHPVRASHWGISIREQGKSMFNALLYKKHPDLYKQQIHSPVLAYHYAIVASSLLCLVSSFAGSRKTGMIMLLAWVASTAALCLKRLRGTTHSVRHILEMATTSVVIPFLSVYWRIVGAIKFNVFFY